MLGNSAVGPTTEAEFVAALCRSNFLSYDKEFSSQLEFAAVSWWVKPGGVSEDDFPPRDSGESTVVQPFVTD
jgi:hypothetical protein